MKITDMKAQVKRPDRCSVFVDGKYSFSSSYAELLDLGLKIGDEFSEQELDKLLGNAEVSKAYEGSLGLIARRPRSEWEIRIYLTRKEYSIDCADQVIEKLKSRNYINDEKFAQKWVRSRRLLKSISQTRLIGELRQKHVSSEIIDEVLSSDTTEDKHALIDLIEKKQKQTRYKDKQKLMSYLSRQGFRYEDIKAALVAMDLDT